MLETLETPIEKLVRELQGLTIPTEITRRSGWLIAYYKGYNIRKPCPHLTTFLLDKFNRGEFATLSAREWLKLLYDAGKLYPKYRA
ncbi:MAG: hypothetical protein V1719_00915 [Patescibacteria group bacterium]